LLSYKGAQTELIAEDQCSTSEWAKTCSNAGLVPGWETAETGHAGTCWGTLGHVPYHWRYTLATVWGWDQ